MADGFDSVKVHFCWAFKVDVLGNIRTGQKILDVPDWSSQTKNKKKTKLDEPLIVLARPYVRPPCIGFNGNCFTHPSKFRASFKDIKKSQVSKRPNIKSLSFLWWFHENKIPKKKIF